MKKHLLSTSAIALGIAMAAPASAQEWNMKWGGFFQTHVGIANVDLPAGDNRDFDGVNIYMNREIHFMPSVTLDNGLTFGVNVQREADNSSSPNADIDETYMFVESDTLGQIIIGNENSAGYKMMVAAPQVGSMPINSQSITGFLPLNNPQSFRGAIISSFTEVERNNDVPRITYFTPSFNGLTLGVSYAPGGEANAQNNNALDFDAAGTLRDIFDIGVGYNQSFNGVDISLGARWGTGERQGTPAVAAVPAGAPTVLPVVGGAPGSTVTVPGTPAVPATAAVASRDPETWGVGGSVSVSGFTFGVGYSENDTDVANNVGDQQGLSVGVSYDIPGPWTVGLEGYFGEQDNGPGTNDSTYDAYKLGASRKLGKGVSWDVYYVYAESEDVTGAQVEGNLFATAINLKF